MSYRHLLVAVDNGADRAELLDKAQHLAEQFGARLSVVSVMAPPSVQTLVPDMGMSALTPVGADASVALGLRDDMQAALMADCAPHGIAGQDVHVVMDHVGSGILSVAAEQGVDLVVVGHRQHKGFLSRLFSHTDESVVSQARCDVLAVVLAPPANQA